MSDHEQGQGGNPVFSIEKIYVKDLSIEVPNAPRIFLEQGAPEINMEIATQIDPLEAGIYQCLLTVTVTAKAADKVYFLVEVRQAGIFRLQDIPQEALEPTLAIACPNILFPYAREAVADATVRAGFPPIHLQPVNFEGLYLQQKQAQAAAQTQ